MVCLDGYAIVYSMAPQCLQWLIVWALLALAAPAIAHHVRGNLSSKIEYLSKSVNY